MVESGSRADLETGDRVLERAVISSKMAAARRLKRRPQPILHRLGTDCGGGKQSPGRVHPAMEGTSGVAERAALRGAAREAALNDARRVSGERQAGT